MARGVSAPSSGLLLSPVREHELGRQQTWLQIQALHFPGQPTSPLEPSVPTCPMRTATGPASPGHVRSSGPESSWGCPGGRVLDMDLGRGVGCRVGTYLTGVLLLVDDSEGIL